MICYKKRIGVYMNQSFCTPQKKENAPSQGAAFGQSKPRAASVFFRHQLELPKKAITKWAGNRKESWNTVKKAFVMRTEQGDEKVRMQIRYPASQIVAGQMAVFFIIGTTAALTAITAWSQTAQAVVGGLVGDYVGNVLAFGAAYCLFNIGRIRSQGIGKILNEAKSFVIGSAVGVGNDFYKKITTKIEEATSTAKKIYWQALRPFAWIAGAAISPVPAAYYIYGGLTAICSAAMHMHPVLAVVVGSQGTTALFIAYANLVNRKQIKKIDEEIAAETKP
jgi:hypothetical protein